MVRKQVYLTADLNRQLRRAAKRMRCSEAEVIRHAISSHLGDAARDPEIDVDSDPLWEIVGSAATEGADLSERVDDVLYGAKR
jgi:hypothetical protein